MQLARIRFPVPARPKIRFKNVALLWNSASGGTNLSTAIKIINRIKFAVAKANVFPQIEAWIRV
jgi:hypothetical protein